MKCSQVGYFRNPRLLTTRTSIVSISENNSKSPSITNEESHLIVQLETSGFYPRGGGQPSDVGIICSDKYSLKVAIVLYNQQGEIDANGAADLPKKQAIDLFCTTSTIMKSQVNVGDEVTATVDPATRQFHNRLHSAGHVIDAALKSLSIDYLVPSKAYHYADGPYVEYTGELKVPKELFIQQMQAQCTKLIDQNLQVFIDFENDDPQDTTCSRSMRIDTLISIPCGGTHVETLSEIGSMTIRKVQAKSGKVKVSYSIA